MPSSRRRGWYCSAAARLQPPVDERPARTAPGLVRPYLSRTRARRRGRARRSPAPRGRRGASFFYADREHGRARRARWAARIPRTPALGTCSHAPLSTSPPTTLRTADRSGVRARSRERGALVQRHLAPLADPRRRVGLRARVCYAREDGWRSRAWPSDGCCPVSSIHPPPSKLYTRRGPRSRLGAARFCVLGGSVGPAIPSCTLDSVESAMPRSFEFGIKNCGHI